jgi:hypothetical protein
VVRTGSSVTAALAAGRAGGAVLQRGCSEPASGGGRRRRRGRAGWALAERGGGDDSEGGPG